MPRWLLGFINIISSKPRYIAGLWVSAVVLSIFFINKTGANGLLAN